MTLTSVQLVIARLKAQAAHRAPGSRLLISPDAVRCLLENWAAAAREGVRLASDGVFVNGVLFEMRSAPSLESGGFRFEAGASAMTHDAGQAGAEPS